MWEKKAGNYGTGWLWARRTYPYPAVCKVIRGLQIEKIPGFSYSIIMIQSPPHRGVQPCLPREGPVKAFRKDAVIVISPLIPR